MGLFKSNKAVRYLFFEMLPSFIMGNLVFIFILLMFQAIRFTEFVLIHGVGIEIVAKLMGYMAISFIPVLFPMSLIFSVIMTYGRLSQDSEIVAFKSVGINQWTLTTPALILGLIVCLLSAQTSFYIAPWGNRQFELLYDYLSQTKASASIKEGTFSEGFFDMVIYANKVDSKTGELEQVFIYDEKDPKQPITIISKGGQIVQDKETLGRNTLLRLQDGDIHRKSETHTKIKFKAYDIKLTDKTEITTREKTVQSLTFDELEEQLKIETKKRAEGKTEQTPESTPKPKKSKKKLDYFASLQTEYHKRLAIPISSLIFAFIGVGFGTQTNRRNAKSGGMILCLILIIIYWALYITAEGMSRSQQADPRIVIWLPNILYFFGGLFALKRAWN